MNKVKRWIVCGLAVCMLSSVTAVYFPASGVMAARAAADIGLKKAKELALKDAGLEAKDVTFTKNEKDREHGQVIFELEFYQEKAEYDYDIDAKTGEILKAEYEVFQPAKKADKSSKQITKAKAKSIALNHAGMKEDDADYIKVKKEREDGITVYEVKIYAGDMKYEYEIHARTGEILRWEREYDD